MPLSVLSSYAQKNPRRKAYLENNSMQQTKYCWDPVNPHLYFNIIKKIENGHEFYTVL